MAPPAGHMHAEQWDPDVCAEKHAWMKWAMGLIFAILVGIMGMIGWMISGANAAMTKAETAVSANSVQDERMQQHWEASQRQNKNMMDLMAKLELSMERNRTEIVAELKENRALVTRMYEERKAKP